MQRRSAEAELLRFKSANHANLWLRVMRCVAGRKDLWAEQDRRTTQFKHTVTKMTHCESGDREALRLVNQ